MEVVFPEEQNYGDWSLFFLVRRVQWLTTLDDSENQHQSRLKFVLNLNDTTCWCETPATLTAPTPSQVRQVPFSCFPAREALGTLKPDAGTWRLNSGRCL